MIQIAICDDDGQDRKRLKEIIHEIMEKCNIQYHLQEYDSGEKLLETSMIFQLIFMDIIMGEIDGIETGRQLYRRNPTIKIIFQTNFGEYCKEALNKSHAFAFLEKPLEKEVVEEQLGEFIVCEPENREISLKFMNVSFILEGKEIIKTIQTILVSDIIYFEYMKAKRQVKIVTVKENYTYSETMHKLERELVPLGFVTSCRGILLNLQKVKKVKGYTVLLKTGGTVPLSQRRVTEFKERLNEYIHNSFH